MAVVYKLVNFADKIIELMGKNREYRRHILPFKDYFRDFKRTLAKDVLMKIYQVFIYIMSEERIPAKFLKNVEGVKDLYEIRVEHESNIFRIFCCFDEGNLVILFNAFQKKTQKTPQGEIERAKRIKDEYFKAKEQYKNSEHGTRRTEKDRL